MGRLDDRVAIVTGAARGIGAAFARGMAAEGARLVLADVKDCGATLKAIEDDGGVALALKVDIADALSVANMVTAALEQFARIDILVNNAALFAGISLRPFCEIPDDEWDRIMAVNARGPFLCCKAVVPHMRKSGYGKIINITSGTVFKGAPMLVPYVSSKGAVLAFTRSLARELGGDNICVNSIAPGFTESEGVLANQGFSDPLKESQVAQRALKRVQKSEDLVGACIFFAAAESDFITGQTLVVDGGALTH